MGQDDGRPGGLPMNEAPADLRHSVGIPDAETERLHVRPADAIQEIIDRYAIAGANLLYWLGEDDLAEMPRSHRGGLWPFRQYPSEREWEDWASDVACRAAFQALRDAKEAVKGYET